MDKKIAISQMKGKALELLEKFEKKNFSPSICRASLDIYEGELKDLDSEERQRSNGVRAFEKIKTAAIELNTAISSGVNECVIDGDDWPVVLMRFATDEITRRADKYAADETYKNEISDRRKRLQAMILSCRTMTAMSDLIAVIRKTEPCRMKPMMREFMRLARQLADITGKMGEGWAELAKDSAWVANVIRLSLNKKTITAEDAAKALELKNIKTPFDD